MMLKNSDVKHKKKCTQLYICELCFAFIRHFTNIYSCFVHVNWATRVYRVFCVNSGRFSASVKSPKRGVYVFKEVI